MLKVGELRALCDEHDLSRRGIADRGTGGEHLCPVLTTVRDLLDCGFNDPARQSESSSYISLMFRLYQNLKLNVFIFLFRLYFLFKMGLTCLAVLTHRFPRCIFFSDDFAGVIYLFQVCFFW